MSAQSHCHDLDQELCLWNPLWICTKEKSRGESHHLKDVKRPCSWSNHETLITYTWVGLICQNQRFWHNLNWNRYYQKVIYKAPTQLLRYRMLNDLWSEIEAKWQQELRSGYSNLYGDRFNLSSSSIRMLFYLVNVHRFFEHGSSGHGLRYCPFEIYVLFPAPFLEIFHCKQRGTSSALQNILPGETLAWQGIKLAKCVGQRKLHLWTLLEKQQSA